MTTVTAHLSALSHARKAEIEALVALIAAADPRLESGIKWNAPSFALEGEHCITLRIAPGEAFQLIFHRGAKPKTGVPDFTDPTGLLGRKSPDRYVLDLKAKALADLEDAITGLVRAWTGAD